jgi:hypothetical protein
MSNLGNTSNCGTQQNDGRRRNNPRFAKEHRTTKRFVLVLMAGLGALIAPMAAAQATWHSLGTGISPNYNPSVTNRPNTLGDQLDLYAIFSDRSIRVNTQEFTCTPRPKGDPPSCGVHFTGWTNLGGIAASAPSAIAWSGHREVFVLGTDLSLWHAWNNVDGKNTSWSGFWSLGQPAGSGGFCSAPDAVSNNQRMDVVVEGCDHRLWHIEFNNGWGAWDNPNQSGLIYTPPSAAWDSTGTTLHVVATDVDGTVWDDAQSPSGFWTHVNTLLQPGQPPAPVQGSPTVGAIAQSPAGGNAMVVAMKTNFNISYMQANGLINNTWECFDQADQCYDSLLGLNPPPTAINSLLFTSDPPPIVPHGGTDVEIIAKRLDGTLVGYYYGTVALPFPKGTGFNFDFNNYDLLGPNAFASGPAAIAGQAPKSIYVFDVDSSGTIWYTYHGCLADC